MNSVSRCYFGSIFTPMRFTQTFQVPNKRANLQSSFKYSSQPEAKENVMSMKDYARKISMLGKQVVYFGIVASGVGAISYVGYVLFESLISEESPNRLYARTLQDIQQNDKVIDAIGLPIKGYGTDSGRGRRNLVEHVEFNDASGEFMKLKFHVTGAKNRATIYSQFRKDGGHYSRELLFMDVPGTGYPGSKRIYLEGEQVMPPRKRIFQLR